jgi:uncharacterized protein YcfL
MFSKIIPFLSFGILISVLLLVGCSSPASVAKNNAQAASASIPLLDTYIPKDIKTTAFALG